MSSVFSDFVRSLSPNGEPPDPSVFDVLLEKLRGALVYELKKRSLWSAPPSYLGIYGGSYWTDDDLLEELLLDCYLFVFIRRLPGLKKQLVVRANIDGLIFLSIRNFLYEAQKRHDPLGFRIFEVAQATVLGLLEAGVLHLLAGDARVRNDTVLGFDAWGDPQAAHGVDLRSQVAVWNSELLPDLITAWSKDDVQARLESLIATLPGEEIEVFQFRDLIEPMKDDARARWQAIQLGSEAEAAPGKGFEALSSIAGWVRPDRGYEERQSFQKLLDCVAGSLESLEARAKTKEYLRRLWLFLRSWTVGPKVRSAGETGAASDGDIGERPPSDLRLAEELDIPRGRIPGLKSALGRLVEGCRERISGRLEGGESNVEVYDSGVPYGQPSYASSEGNAVMDSKNRREQLRLQTGEAATIFAQGAARLAERDDRPPRPGETFLFAEASALPVEWAFLELDAVDPRRALLAPVDDHPFNGSRDVAASSGVAILRCGLGTWLNVEALNPERRVGVLDLEDLDRARRKWAEIAGGTLSVSMPEQEVDSSPEYLAWMRMLAEARTALPGGPRVASPDAFWERKPSTVLPFRRPADWQRDASASPAWKDHRAAYALAATFAAAVLGLSMWTGRLRTELSSPILLSDSFSGEIVFLDRDRTIEPLALRATASHVVIHLLILQVDDFPAYRVELLEKQGEDAIWTSAAMAQDPQFLLALPRRLLTAEKYRLRLYGQGEAGEERVLEEREVRITAE